MSLSREAKNEFNCWKTASEEARHVGINPNNSKFNAMFRAIAMWGEALAALRCTQPREHRKKAMSMAKNRYASLKRKLNIEKL